MTYTSLLKRTTLGLATSLMVLSLVACGRSEQSAMSKSEMITAVDAEAAAADGPAASVARSQPEPAPAPGQPNLPPTTIQQAMIAYSYSMGLELPAKQVIPLRDAHVKACAAAGQARCQLLGTSSNAVGKDEVAAELRLRGEPKWLEGFRASIQMDADKSDGRLVTNSISSEDLTRQMVDTEAMLRAQTRLRDRLTDLLSRHQGKLADLLEVERELARVQGEIDARTSALNVMRTRIAMSDLTIGYQSEGVALSDQTADPTVQALREFLSIVSRSFAGLIRFAAGVLPWLLILVPAGWYIRRWRRNRPAAKAAT
jgi:hypothetical protein